MSIFRQKGRQNNAKVFLKEFDQTENTYFISIGNSVTNPLESITPTIDTVEMDQYTWDNMFFVSQLNRDDLTLMIPQYTWTANTRYEAFNKSINQYENGEKFYVFNTSNRRVYLCVSSPDNNNSLSMYPPTGSSLQQLETKPDGYTWKFLYEIEELTLQKFQYPGYIPISEVGTDLYTDVRVLQQGVQSSSVKGTIEAITLVNQGYPIFDAFNVNFAYPSAVLQVTSSSSTNIVFELDANISNTFVDLIKTENYYIEKYVVNFENGYTAVIDKSYVNEENGNFVIEICEDLVCASQSTNLPSGERFRILPRVKIIGNGEGACAIPIMDITKRITGITIINGGQNYSYAEAELFINNGTILRPIISLNGLASDITQLLGAKHVMISKQIKPTTNLSESNPALYEKPENAGIVYTGSQYDNVISQDTYYTQISLLKSPRLPGTDSLQIIAGASTNIIQEMVIESINPKVNIVIGNSATPFLNFTSFFNTGDTITRGPTGAKDQFRAIIEEIYVSGISTTLVCSLINGAFDTYYGYRLKNLKFETDIANEEDDVTFTFAGCTGDCSNMMYATYENVFSVSNFTTDDALFGSESLQTVKIIKPSVGYSYVDPRYPNKARIRVLNPAKEFIPARYEEGQYIQGEVMTALKNVSYGVTTPTTTGTLAAITAPSNINPETDPASQTIYSCCYILECTIDRDGIDTPFQLVNSDNITLETNTLIRQGTEGARGKIIRVALPTDALSNKMYLYVNNYSKEFTVNNEWIYQINDLYDPTTYKNMKIKVTNIKKLPDLIKYSGDLLYINSVGPVQRRLNNTEQVKLLVEF